MKQLELKHLAPYLPFGLKIVAPRKYIGDLSALDGLYCELRRAIAVDRHYIPSVTPILRPLHLLTETIIHKRETFVPIVELCKIHDNGSDAFQTIEKTHDKKLFSISYLSCGECEAKFSYSEKLQSFGVFYKGASAIYRPINQKKLFDKLNEWMFDTDSLIDTGLAVSTETLDKDPYS